MITHPEQTSRIPRKPCVESESKARCCPSAHGPQRAASALASQPMFLPCRGFPGSPLVIMGQEGWQMDWCEDGVSAAFGVCMYTMLTGV